MSGDSERPIIIIKKKVHGGHGHHGGSWKVAIADLMTAMMALFMVLWLVGQSPKTRATVGAYFRDPLGLAGGGNTDVNTGPWAGGAGFFSGGNTAISTDMLISPGSPRGKGGGAEQDQRVAQQHARDRLAQALMKLRHDAWSRHVELTRVEEGLRIEIQDTEKHSLFPTGGTSINSHFRDMMTQIANEIGNLPNQVVIEGHTDASPYSRGRISNWEISTQRANSARRFLIANGLRADQVVEVRGYADQRLRLWHDPKNPRNRRISLLVLLKRGTKRSLKTSDADPSQSHTLNSQLNNLDYKPKAGDPIELSPAGIRLPNLPKTGPN